MSNVINLGKGEKINLSKIDSIDLSKGGKGLRKVEIGLGWDEASSGGSPVKSRGIFGMFRTSPSVGSSQEIDCDAFAYLIDNNNKLRESTDVVWYGNLSTPDKVVKHSGDNLVGGSDGDDEQIVVDLSKLDREVSKLVVGVNIYQGKSKRQHFGMLKNAYIRIVDTETQTELCRFKLDSTYDGATSMFFGELVRQGNDWEFLATGEVGTEGNIMNIVRDRIKQ